MRKVARVPLMAAAVLVLIAMASAPASAHPPGEMTLIFNDRLDVLTVAVGHDVKDPRAHYVEQVQVYINQDSLIFERTYTSQPRDSYNERFALEAEEGDVIRVTATCNQGGTIEREVTVGSGISTAGDGADMVVNMVYVHATLQILGLVLAVGAMPIGMHFYRAWRTKTKPTRKRRRHVRIGTAAIVAWGVGSAGGLYIVYMTSGDYLGSIHGWLALGTFAAALFTGHAASIKFRKAGYGERMKAHMPMAFLTIILGIFTILCGMITWGMI